MPLNNIPMLIKENSVTLILDGVPFVINSSHPNYQLIRDAIKNEQWDDVKRLVNITTAIKDFVASDNKFTFDELSRTFQYNGQPLNSSITERILALMDQKFPVDPLINFLNNLLDNPSKRAITELYTFLAACDLPITEDGHFLAYKKVCKNYTDIHSGTFDNSIGSICEMPRNLVDEDASRTCSTGLHFCSYSYLNHYGYDSDSRVIVVKINPKDVVAIPDDYSNAKGRTCRYIVVDEITDYHQEQLERYITKRPTSKKMYVSPFRNSVSALNLADESLHVLSDYAQWIIDVPMHVKETELGIASYLDKCEDGYRISFTIAGADGIDYCKLYATFSAGISSEMLETLDEMSQGEFTLTNTYSNVKTSDLDNLFRVVIIIRDNNNCSHIENNQPTPTASKVYIAPFRNDVSTSTLDEIDLAILGKYAKWIIDARMNNSWKVEAYLDGHDRNTGDHRISFKILNGFQLSHYDLRNLYATFSEGPSRELINVLYEISDYQFELTNADINMLKPGTVRVVLDIHDNAGYDGRDDGTDDGDDDIEDTLYFSNNTDNITLEPDQIVAINCAKNAFESLIVKWCNAQLSAVTSSKDEGLEPVEGSDIITDQYLNYHADINMYQIVFIVDAYSRVIENAYNSKDMLGLAVRGMAAGVQICSAYSKTTNAGQHRIIMDFFIND